MANNSADDFSVKLSHAYVGTLTVAVLAVSICAISGEDYQGIYLFVTNPMPNPFAACSGSAPQCSAFSFH